MATQAICSIPECGKTHLAKGWCRKHYLRNYRTGKTSTDRTPAGAGLEWLISVAMAYDGDECLSWPFGRNAYGYGLATVDGQQKIASRILCEMVHGAPPNTNYDAAHSCGFGAQGCTTKSHLRWDTRAGNMADKIAHGTLLRGERSNLSKLSEADVREIRELAKTGAQREIAAHYGIDQSTVSDIKRRKSWAHLD